MTRGHARRPGSTGFPEGHQYRTFHTRSPPTPALILRSRLSGSAFYRGETEAPREVTYPGQQHWDLSSPGRGWGRKFSTLLDSGICPKEANMARKPTQQGSRLGQDASDCVDSRATVLRHRWAMTG